ncbi:MAG: hypothetical protein OEY67_11135, partial [Gammaproteobacteria bacterium]|nr:hypothetical protein [Gammaproteobacteria bacterium]
MKLPIRIGGLLAIPGILTSCFVADNFEVSPTIRQQAVEVRLNSTIPGTYYDPGQVYHRDGMAEHYFVCRADYSKKISLPSPGKEKSDSNDSFDTNEEEASDSTPWAFLAAKHLKVSSDTPNLEIKLSDYPKLVKFLEKHGYTEEQLHTELCYRIITGANVGHIVTPDPLIAAFGMNELRWYRKPGKFHLNGFHGRFYGFPPIIGSAGDQFEIFIGQEGTLKINDIKIYRRNILVQASPQPISLGRVAIIGYAQVFRRRIIRDELVVHEKLSEKVAKILHENLGAELQAKGHNIVFNEFSGKGWYPPAVYTREDMNAGNITDSANSTRKAGQEAVTPKALQTKSAFNHTVNSVFSDIRRALGKGELSHYKYDAEKIKKLTQYSSADTVCVSLLDARNSNEFDHILVCIDAASNETVWQQIFTTESREASDMDNYIVRNLL